MMVVDVVVRGSERGEGSMSETGGGGGGWFWNNDDDDDDDDVDRDDR